MRRRDPRIPPFAKTKIAKDGAPVGLKGDRKGRGTWRPILPPFLFCPSQHRGCPILCGEAARVLQLRNKGWDLMALSPTALLCNTRSEGHVIESRPSPKPKSRRMGHPFVSKGIGRPGHPADVSD